MLIKPRFKKSLVVEQFQGNYLNRIKTNKHKKGLSPKVN